MKQMKCSESVLVVAPSRKTRGGITSVLKLYEQHEFWYSCGCYWLETHIDKSFVHKLWYFIKAWINFHLIVFEFGIIHIHFSEPPSAFRKFLFMFPSWLLKKKIILHFHSFSPDTTLYGKYHFLYKWMFNHADAIVVLSHFWKEHVARIMKHPDRLMIIHNPARSIYTATQKENVILFAGTLSDRKGYKDLIKAFVYINRWHKDWKLILAGNGEISTATALISSLGLKEVVCLKGWVEGREKDALFKAASIFCLPSYAEGFPMSVIDAMSYGLPVVTTPVGGVMDIFTENEDLLIVKPGSIKELAMKLDMLILSPAIGKKMIRSSREKIKTHFDLDLVASKLKGLYGQLSKHTY